MRFRKLKTERFLPVARQFVAAYPNEFLAKLKKLLMSNPLLAEPIGTWVNWSSPLQST